MTRPFAVFLIVATASSSVSLPRATIATSAPDWAKRVATARPMPLLPPVTMAVRPERLISIKQLPTIPLMGTALFLEHDPEKWNPVSHLREARFGGRRKVGQDHAPTRRRRATERVIARSCAAGCDRVS